MAKPDSIPPFPPASPSPATPVRACGRKYFTVNEALRALPLVKRIARDMQATQNRRLSLHAQIEVDVLESPGNRRHSLNQRDLDQQTERLEDLVEELDQIGVQLKDPHRGLVDFPAFYLGREVLLCWQADEATITHWHEIDSGYAGRREIAELVGG